ncbi:hypothetical protein [Mycobacterium seoulense]|uniref:hypothetical protein n=1 Tax=Mycobacterium seoulense TaxID=386911 RepID=UPI001E2DB200|nr:hypothetical protein [Mycobacterium seoulense]
MGDTVRISFAGLRDHIVNEVGGIGARHEDDSGRHIDNQRRRPLEHSCGTDTLMGHDLSRYQTFHDPEDFGTLLDQTMTAQFDEFT